MQAPIEPARHGDFLNIAALDRIAWLHTGEQYIADGEHVWCERWPTFPDRWGI